MPKKKTDPTPTPANSPEDKVEAVARKAKKTATKVASAVKETVKDIADKVARKTTTRKKSDTTATPKSRPAGSLDGAATRNSPRAATKSSTTPRATKATKVGALTPDVTSQDILKTITQAHSSEDAATDIKEHYLHDQALSAGPPPPQPPRHLPEEYGDTRLVLLVRDPEYVFAYWEINDQTRQEINLPRGTTNRRMVLRMFKITGRDWPNQAAHYFFDVDVDANARSWYIHLPEPNESWCAELGIFDENQHFQPICRSNWFITPRTSISDEVDTEWMTVEESFEKITRVSGAGHTLQARLRGDTPTASESILRHIHKQITGVMQGERPALSSAIFSSESPIAPNQSKDFWLQVNTELILYGATEPDATVTVQGKPISLNPDGTFSIRYALPDGEQVLEVHATKSTKDMEETITPIVTRRTI